MNRTLPLLCGILVAACAPVPGSTAPRETVLRDGSGADIGRVTLRERGERIQVHVRAYGLSQGLHGMHLHETGLCEGPAFQTAGPHLNPGGLRHGRRNPQGPHRGDLGNLVVGASGRGEATVEVLGADARAGLPTFLGPNGLALVIHEGQDDELTDPSGNSGGRIACAALLP